jgi:hypothetical protein
MWRCRVRPARLESMYDTLADREGSMKSVLAVIAAAVAAGCATPGPSTEKVVGSAPAADAGQVQSVALETVDAAQAPVEAARCSLRNDKGTWEVRTPGSASVMRSTRALEIVCLKPGYRAFVHATESQGDLVGSAVKGAALGGAATAVVATPLLAIPVFGPLIYAGTVGGTALLGGAVSAVMDHDKGTPYRYPDRLVLPLTPEHAGRR